jgi:hypothetical protein
MGPPYFASTNGQDAAPPKTYYEQQREMLVTEIAQVRATAHHGAHCSLSI